MLACYIRWIVGLHVSHAATERNCQIPVTSSMTNIHLTFNNFDVTFVAPFNQHLIQLFRER